MTCQAKVYLYSDLEGKLTGEFDLDCAGTCPGGVPCIRRQQSIPGMIWIWCGCGPGETFADRLGRCSMTLIVEQRPNSKATIKRQCSNRLCGKDRECRKCRVVSYGKSLTVLDLDGPNPRIRQVEEFRCECLPVSRPRGLQSFYERTLCKIVSFAVRSGVTLSPIDFFHCHVLLNARLDESHVDVDEFPVMDEQFMIDHYAGLLGHVHEYDGQRALGAPANIHMPKDGDPQIAGGSHALDPISLSPPSYGPKSIYFRPCAAGEDCPPCTTKIFCPDIQKHLCVGLRSDWPEGDPALGQN